MDAGTVGLEEWLSLALGYLPDIRLHASLVLCALAVAWFIAIRRRAIRQPPSSRHRRKSMTSKSTSREAHRSRATSRAGFRIKWGRTVIALVVLLALVAFLVAGLAALIGAGTGLAAAVAALIAAAGVVALRALALQDRKRRRDRRIEQAFTEAMNPPVATATATAAPAAHSSSAVFDAASGATDERPESADVVIGSPSTARDENPGGAAPQPVVGEQAGLPSVPRPTYLDAAEVLRPAPEPLPRPEVPALQPGTTLKSGVSGEYLAKVQATASTTLDLDKVLERRRAV